MNLTRSTRWPSAFRPNDDAAAVHGTAINAVAEPGSGTGLHEHQTGQIAIAVKGVVGVGVEDRILPLPVGTACWVPPGVLHDGLQGEGSVSWYLLVRPSLARGLPTEVVRFFVSPLCRAAAERLLNVPAAYADESPLGRIASVFLDEVRGAERIPEHFAVVTRHPVVKRAAQLLMKEPSVSLSREMIAAATGLSERQFARILQSETGLSFSEWRLHLVMLRATVRLREGASVEETALEAGYASASAFTVAFRRVFSTTPGAYRSG